MNSEDKAAMDDFDEFRERYEQEQQKMRSEGLGYGYIYIAEPEDCDFYMSDYGGENKPVSLETLKEEFGEMKVQDMCDDIERIFLCHGAVDEIRWSIGDSIVAARF